MKIVISIALLFFLCMPSNGSGQDFPDAKNYDMTLRVLNKKGKTYKGAGISAYIKGVDKYYEFPRSGVIKIMDVNPSDTLCITSSVALFEFPVMGLDSINVVLRNNSHMEGFYRNEREEIERYGHLTVTKKIESNTGNTVKIEGAAHYRTLLELIKGRVAGVEVNERAGTIKIRGINSINASSEPLFVVNGVSMDANSANLGVNPRMWKVSRWIKTARCTAQGVPTA